MSSTKGLTRPITKKQARSYERLIPNGIGVTAIAALSNGRKRSVAKSRSRKNTSSGEAMKKNKKKRLSGAAFKKSPQYKKMMAGLRRHQAGGKKRARRNGPARELNDAFDAQMAAARAAKAKSAPKPKRKVAKKSPAKKRATVAARAAASKKRLGKSYGPFKSLKAKVGTRSYPTYAYRGSKGKAKKIPLWAILGTKSKKDLERKVSDDPRTARRVVATKRRRDRKASKLMLHGDLFTPNNAVSFEQWSENMKPNKRKKKKSGKRRSAAQRAATKKLVALNKKRGGSPRKRKSAKRRKSGSAPKRRKGARRSAAQRAATKKLVALNKKRGGSPRKRKSAKRRKSGSAPKRRKGARRKTGGTKVRFKKGTSQKARARVKKMLRKRFPGRKFYNENRRRRSRKSYSENRRRRSYRRNPDWMAQIKSVAVIGAMVTAGFVVHRAASYLLSEKVLSQVSLFQSGSGAKYRSLFGGVVVAAVGIPLVAKFSPKHAGKIGAGMVTSLLHKVLLTVLGEAGQGEAAGYLSGYPDASGSAYRHLGSYYETGVGEYMQMQGFGAAPNFMQAAAGYGASPNFMQAAAGMGSPRFSQAAAGVGEYVAQNLRGIGEYEQAAAGIGGMGEGLVDEGIDPTVDSAEYALTMAEQMSGIGDTAMQSTVNPRAQPEGIDDSPRGSRAGILEGSGGIFG